MASDAPPRPLRTPICRGSIRGTQYSGKVATNLLSCPGLAPAVPILLVDAARAVLRCYPSMKLVMPILIGGLFAGMSFALRERWGMSASLWFFGVLLTLWFVFWLVTKHFEKKLRERGIDIPEEDG